MLAQARYRSTSGCHRGAVWPEERHDQETGRRWTDDLDEKCVTFPHRHKVLLCPCEVTVDSEQCPLVELLTNNQASRD